MRLFCDRIFSDVAGLVLNFPLPYFTNVFHVILAGTQDTRKTKCNTLLG